MKFGVHYYNGSEVVINHNTEIKDTFKELLDDMKRITEEEIVEFKKGKFSKNLSISKALNFIIDYKLLGADYISDVPIDKDIISKKKWAIKYVKNGILVNVCFKHNLNTSHELLKLELAVRDNYNPDMVNNKVGVLITLTDKLKNLGGFDNSVCTYELIKSEMELYKRVINQPLVIIALDEVSSFEISILNNNGGRKSYVNEY
ncbi:MAG: hypothetical protein N4A76_01325 [Firmicutes bacterium]|jgi:hypothetical protein|nr:hypothetical protein [Bacillota bacterium]